MMVEDHPDAKEDEVPQASKNTNCDSQNCGTHWFEDFRGPGWISYPDQHPGGSLLPSNIFGETSSNHMGFGQSKHNGKRDVDVMWEPIPWTGVGQGTTFESFSILIKPPYFVHEGPKLERQSMCELGDDSTNLCNEGWVVS